MKGLFNIARLPWLPAQRLFLSPLPLWGMLARRLCFGGSPPRVQRIMCSRRPPGKDWLLYRHFLGRGDGGFRPVYLLIGRQDSAPPPGSGRVPFEFGRVGRSWRAGAAGCVWPLNRWYWWW